MTIKSSSFPTVRPSLDLNFAQTKRLDPRVTFSRASSATFVDVDGLIKSAATNAPRFDHAPTTAESLGLLVEEARTNSCQYSEHISLWDSYPVQANAVVAPDGTITADGFFSPDGFNGPGRSSASVAAGTYTFSAWVKSPNRTNCYLRTSGSGVSGEGYRTISSTWTRVSIVTTSTSAGSIYLEIRGSNQGSGEFHVWGAQLEAGSFPTSYIPTPATFTGRSSTATYYDANGVIQTAGSGVARSNAFFPDSNGVMRSAGLLLEESRTNLLIYSNKLNEFFTSGTAYGGGYGGGWQNAPADITELTDSYGTYYNTISNLVWSSYGTCQISSSTNYVVSFFAKSSTIASIRPRLYSNTTGTVSTGSYISLQTGGVLYPGGWRKFTFTMPTTSNSGNSIIIELNTGSGFDIKNIQVEQGSYPTSYIPTTTSTVTRAADTSTSATVTRSADVAQITGTNFSSWYRQDEGTVYTKGVSFLSAGLADNPGPFVFTDSANSGFANRIGLMFDRGAYQTLTLMLWDFSGSGSQDIAFTGAAEPAQFQPYSIATAIKNTNSACATNGTVIANSASFLSTYRPANIARLQIAGSAYVPTGSLSGTISRLTYWPTRLSDATLQAITR